MKDFFVEYDVEITSAIVSLVVTIITLLVTHLLGNLKLVYAEKAKIIGELSKAKYEGVNEIREKIKILSQYENLSITENPEDLIPENIGGKVYTPSCCYDYATLIDFASTLNDLHGIYGHCLSHRSVIYLVYIRAFLMDYLQKCSLVGFSNQMLRWVSVPLYSGMHKWYKRFDRELIRSMNRVSRKYYSHSGMVYNVLLKLYGIYFNHTKPYKYMNDDDSELNILIDNPENIMALVDDEE